MAAPIEARDLAALTIAVERAGGDFVAIIPPDLSPLTQRVLRAAVEGLAIACAPTRRINAVAPDAGADPADVAAAVRFLEHATSTTGQILSISARSGPTGE